MQCYRTVSYQDPVSPYALPLVNCGANQALGWKCTVQTSSHGYFCSFPLDVVIRDSPGLVVCAGAVISTGEAIQTPSICRES
jgi:hypothetical protein